MENDVVINSHGRRLEGKLYLPSGVENGVVIAHSYRNSMDEPVCLQAAQELQKAGYATLRFNFTGHGNSSGGLEDVCFRVVADDFSAAMNLLKENMEGSIGAFAVSIGTAGVILSHARPNAQILLSPLPNTAFMYQRYKDHINSHFTDLERDGYITLESASGRGDFKMGKEWVEESAVPKLDLAGRYKAETVPTLLVHGTYDELINYEETLKLVKENPKFDMLLLGADHNFNDMPNREILMKTIIPWLNWNLR